MTCKHEEKSGVTRFGVIETTSGRVTKTCLGCGLTADEGVWELLRAAEERAPVAEELLATWFHDVRELASELSLTSNRISEDMDITLVGRGSFFGARCGRYAATGETPTEAMTRLRGEMRKMLNAERRAHTHAKGG